MRKHPYTMQQLDEFLAHNNYIEGVRDEDSFDQAKFAWNFLDEEDQMSIHAILKTHKILMLHQPLMPNERGYFRYITVYIGGKPALNALHIEERIIKWVDDMNALPPRLKKDREELAKQLHIEYERIHPFVDGNGRTGRMFLNWLRLRWNLPLLIIHEGEEQFDYYTWFR